MARWCLMAGWLCGSLVYNGLMAVWLAGVDGSLVFDG